MTQTYHFIGLGGIGMSALARILLQKGHVVQGTDSVDSELLQQLKKEGAMVRIGHSDTIALENTTVIYSSAIKETNVELMSAKKQKAKLFHRSDLLDFLMKGKKNLLVTGTHGKTTTTALLASVFMEADLDPTMVLGGYLRPLNTNAKAGRGEYFIAEADESDGSFLKTAAFGAIVTNLGRDHLDYWKSEEQLREAFHQFFLQAQEEKHLFWCMDDPYLASFRPKGRSYGFSSQAELFISRFESTEKGIIFSIQFQGKNHEAIELGLSGRHNALNAAAVFGLSLSLGIDETKIRSAFQKFAGTGRRLEWKGEEHRLSLYDDYGHHPTEISTTLKALRDKIRERRLVVLFQPHRYSRVADLWEKFFHCFEEADLVVLTDIYAASEMPIEGVSSSRFYQAMRDRFQEKVCFIPRGSLESDVIQLLKPLDVVLTLGAGDITSAGIPVLQKWKEKAPRLKVALLCGGTSSEHEVSLMSAANIIQGLDPSIYNVKWFGITKQGQWLSGADTLQNLKEKKFSESSSSKISSSVLEELVDCDLAIPVFHGPQGEDGMIQAFLDTLQISYVGCEYRGAVLCMQKAWTKYIALLNHIPTAAFLETNKWNYRKNPEDFLEKIEADLSFPVWIKPAHLGSSIGVSRALNREEAKKAIELSFLYDEILIAEKEIEGRQIEFAVLGNDYVRVMNCCEILNHGSFYDYEKKYGADAVGTDIPAKITPLEKMVGLDLAKRAYIACGCKGMARVDFFLDTQGHYWLNEINPFPGFTVTSGYPKMCEAAGMSPQKLWDELIALGLHRSRALAKIRGK